MAQATANTMKKLFNMLFVDKPDPNKNINRTGFKALYRKELMDHFRSKRFLLVLVLIAITGLGSVIGAGFYIRQNAGSASFTFLDLFTISGSSLPSLVSFLSFLGPIVGLALGFDAINGERSKRTLSRLVSQPIYRDTVINGKFVAGVSVIFMMVLSLGVIVGALGVIMTGVIPTVEQILRVFVFMFYTIVYMSLWLAVSLLFSLLFRQAATSALSGIALWLFFAIFLGMLATLIANTVAPVTADPNSDITLYAQQLRVNDAWSSNISRISPTTLYSEAVSVLLNPSQKALGLMGTVYQMSGQHPGNLSIGQSMIIVWPHLTGLIALNIIVFAISYISFMKQEIRA